MKWKQILTIGLSAATIMSAAPGEGMIVYADAETEAIKDGGEETSEEAGVQAENSDTEPEISITDEEQAEETDTTQPEEKSESTEIGLSGDSEKSVEENTESEGLFSDGTEDLAEAVGADSEYGTVIDSGTIPDETNGTEVTWTVYDSGKLVIGGTGVTPDWSPWFNYKEDITDVIIGDEITALGERNFINYPALKTVTMQGSLSKIGNSAFEGCEKLKNITVTGKTNAAGLKVIMLGECAFKDCTGLENVEFTGNFVTYKNAFEGCISLQSIKVKESTMIMLGEYTFLNCSALTEADLPGSRTKSVGEGAFFGCTSLKQFDFSDVSRIAKSAFYNCSSLESIKIPDKASTIEECAFYGCSSLKSIEIPENITSIGDAAFWGCSGIKTLKIPGNVATINKTAFGKCTGLEEIDMEEGVQTVAEAAFADCSSLNTMILPKSVSNFATNFVTDYKPVKKICYRGTRAEWIAANLNSDRFFNAKIYFEYSQDHKHQMITRSYTYPESCTRPGTKETFCSVCGYVESSAKIPAQGHKWKTESTVKNTCTKAGMKHLVCARCGEKKNEKIPAAGHRFSAWKTTAGATVFSAAVQTHTCSGCGKKETRTTGKKLTPTMKVNVTNLPLKIKQQTRVLKVTGLAKGDSVAAWKSSNTRVVKVSGRTNGTCTIVAGNGAGRAAVTVTLKSGLKKNIAVTVQKKAVETTRITGIAGNISLKRGKPLALKPAVTPLTSLQKITYSSSNKKVATVTSKGVIRALKKGTAVITVRSRNKTVKCKVTVK